jgi:hypothetical protein
MSEEPASPATDEAPVPTHRASSVTTRVGAAIALVLSIAAHAFAIVAFMATVRDDGPTRGRLVQSRLTNEDGGAPLLFPLDEFYIGRDSQAHQRAFYVYPPGYYGHSRGCKIVWDDGATAETLRGTVGPGLYVDPCGGARWNRDGELLSGPADRGLDEFATQPGVEGVIVDTRRLLCGAEYIPPPTFTPQPAQATIEAATASVVAQTASVIARTESPVPSVTPRPTISGTPERTPCERVSPDTKKP